MVSSMSIVASASDDAVSGGSIDFIEGDDKGIVPPVDPDKEPGTDPDEVPDPNPEYPETDNWGLHGQSLDFGLQEVSNQNRTYNSVEESRTMNGRLAGLLVDSNLPEWAVSLEISQFDNGGLGAFVLDMTPADKDGNAHAGFTHGNATIAPETRTLNAPAEGQTRSAAVRIASGTRGISGANFMGDLMVPGGAADVFEYQAELFWNYGAKGVMPLDTGI